MKLIRALSTLDDGIVACRTRRAECSKALSFAVGLGYQKVMVLEAENGTDGSDSRQEKCKCTRRQMYCVLGLAAQRGKESVGVDGYGYECGCRCGWEGTLYYVGWDLRDETRKVLLQRACSCIKPSFGEVGEPRYESLLCSTVPVEQPWPAWSTAPSPVLTRCV